MNKQIITEEQEKQLNALLLDTDGFKKLDKYVGEFNIFDTLGISRWEIKHSNFLAWLLSPSENHNLGSEFLNGVIKRVLTINQDMEYNAQDLLLLDTASCYVKREWKDIDILVSSPSAGLVITIENKIGSSEHDNQLDKYRNIIEQDFKEYKYKLYIYLTPERDKPSDQEHWTVLGYEDIAELLEGLLNTHENMNDEVRTLIKHYVTNIRRNVVKDRELEEICNEIYKSHRAAFDLVYKYKTLGRSRLYDAINDVIDEYDKEGKIIKDEKGNLVFRTAAMNEKLPPLSEPKSSWGDKYLYQFWFYIADDGVNSSFYLIFELGGLNVPENEKKMMKELIAKYRPNYRKNEFEYNRIYKTKKVSISNDAENYYEKATQAARDAINEILCKTEA